MGMGEFTMIQCSYYYHTLTNVPPRRCALMEGHGGPHVEQIPQLPPQPSNPPTGWIKH